MDNYDDFVKKFISISEEYFKNKHEFVKQNTNNYYIYGLLVKNVTDNDYYVHIDSSVLNDDYSIKINVLSNYVNLMVFNKKDNFDKTIFVAYRYMQAFLENKMLRENYLELLLKEWYPNLDEILTKASEIDNMLDKQHKPFSVDIFLYGYNITISSSHKDIYDTLGACRELLKCSLSNFLRTLSFQIINSYNIYSIEAQIFIELIKSIKMKNNINILKSSR